MFTKFDELSQNLSTLFGQLKDELLKIDKTDFNNSFSAEINNAMLENPLLRIKGNMQQRHASDNLDAVSDVYRRYQTERNKYGPNNPYGK